MKTCKVNEREAQMMLNTLDRIAIAPGLDNADMYVGLGQMIQHILDGMEEEAENG